MDTAKENNRPVGGPEPQGRGFAWTLAPGKEAMRKDLKEERERESPRCLWKELSGRGNSQHKALQQDHVPRVGGELRGTGAGWGEGRLAMGGQDQVEREKVLQALSSVYPFTAVGFDLL